MNRTLQDVSRSIRMFTLIELLVVIAILAGKLFPALSSGGGQINVAQNIQTNEKAAGTLPNNMSCTMTIEKRYLNFPIKNGGPNCKLCISIDGQPTYNFDVALADKQPDWWAFMDLSQFLGRKVTLQIDKVPEGSKGLTAVEQTDQLTEAAGLYNERFRPQFHFSTRRGWINDPNGLIYYKGDYNLYYQHNPFGITWGNMSWGHAVSKDLVHWQELPTVLFPNPATGDCYSGAAFIDSKNQLDRKRGDEDVLVAFYLRTKIGLCLAYSNDRGRTFTDYERNPVLTHEGERIDSPRPFWYEPTGRWITATYDWFINAAGEKRRAVGFYSSANLTDWKFESRVEQDGWGDELCGCVDFFQLPVDGDPKNKKWVMIFIDGSYLIGSFDGHVFYTLAGKPATTQDRIRSLVIPGNYYATMTWENVPNDLRVQIAWMGFGPLAVYPGMPFSQQMTIPLELSLHSTPAGLRLYMNPINELNTLRADTREWKDIMLKPGQNPLSGANGELLDVETEFAPTAGAKIVLDLRGIKVTYDSDSRKLDCAGVSATLEPEAGVIKLRIMLDRSSIEVFGNDGQVYIPVVVFPESSNRSLSAGCSQGEVKAHFLRVNELRSIWD